MATTRKSNGRRTAGTKQAVRRNRPKFSPTQLTAIITAAIGAAATIIVAALGLFSTAGGSPQSSQAPATSTAPPPASRAPATPGPTAPRTPGDNSAFIADVTYPDGSTVTEGQHFLKRWKIRNTGTVLWASRYLAPVGSSTGLCSYPARVKVPDTRPGQDVIISVPVTASTSPGLCFVTWKMVTAAGSLYFPNEIGIWFSVKVIT
jgi:Ig-like domain from next to BRCA1 gene